MSAYNIEWLNSNLHRAYPIRENSSLQSVEGSYLPNYVLVDAVFCLAHGQVLEKAFYLSRLVYTADYLSLYFSSTFNIEAPDATDIVSLGYVTIPLADAVAYGSYRLSLADEYYEDSNCKIVIGEIQRLVDDLTPGVYTFDWNSAALEPHVVRPSLRQVRALQTINGSDVSGYVRGHVKLVSGNNIRLTAVGTDTIRIDAIVSDGFAEACVCDGSFPLFGAIKSINGVYPDSAGNIRLVSGDCIQIEEGSSVLVIRDSCSVPCCGCDELAALVSNFAVAESAINRMASNLDRLSEKQSSFYNAVIMTLL